MATSCTVKTTTKTITLDHIPYHTLLETSHFSPPNPHHAQPPRLVLLVHALMSSHHMWDSTVPYLHRLGYSTLRFDHVGHNLTPPPSNPESFSLRMDDVVQHMHHLVRDATEVESGLKSMTLAGVMGCSIGGVLALRYAMLHPAPGLKVISIAAPGIASPPKAHDLWTQRIELFEKDVASGGEELRRTTVERWFPNGRAEDDEARKEALEHVRTCSLEGYKVLADTIRRYDYSGEEVERLSGRAEVLIVCGEEDAACDLDGMREVAGRIEGSEFVVMERTGHLPPMQKAREFEEILVPFLER